MPSPSSSLATMRPDLRDSLKEFDLMGNEGGFIGYRVMPVFDTQEASGTFGRIPVEELLKNIDTRRNAQGGYAESEWEFIDESFSTQEHGAQQKVDDRNARVYRHYFDAELVATGIARHQVMLNAEKRIADALFNATTFTPTTVTNEWDDKTNATPVDDVLAARKRVYAACGMWPDALIINQTVFENVRITDQVRDFVASSGAGSSNSPANITPRQLAQVFNLEVVVAGGTQNSANEGQTASLGHIWSNEYAMVAKIARTQAIEEPCIGRTLHWSQDGSELLGTIESFRDENVRADKVRVRHEVQEKTLLLEAADLMDNITT